MNEAQTETAIVIVYNQLDGKQIQFPKQIEQFSVILSIDLGNESTKITVPSIMQIPTSAIQQLKSFLQLHSYNPKQIKTQPISPTSQPYSKICTPATAAFINKHLVEKNDEEIRVLWTAANYFRMEMVSRVIALFLLERYGLPFQDEKLKEVMAKYGVDAGKARVLGEEGDEGAVKRNQNYDQEWEKKQSKRRQLQKLKQRYLTYFKSYGAKILMDIDQQYKPSAKQI